MVGVKIVGLGKALPKMTLTNDEISQRVDTSDEWITTRTGIKSRHIATTETTTQLATKAAQMALKESGLSPDEIELVIVATASPDTMMPSTACLVAKALDINTARCFDLSAACSGFIFASEVAIGMMGQSGYHNALVIGAEVLSKYVDWQDRSTCVLFGDGAGAVIYKRSEKGQVIHIETGSEPKGASFITLPTHGESQPFYQAEMSPSFIQMIGRSVYSFAVTKVPKSIEAVVAKNDLTLEEIDWFVLHQANSRIIDGVAQKLKLPTSRFFKNVISYGNTSAASIPIALCELSSQLKAGDKMILSGFGAGLTWGTMLLVW